MLLDVFPLVGVVFSNMLYFAPMPVPPLPPLPIRSRYHGARKGTAVASNATVPPGSRLLSHVV